ncbi:hypothetical protein COU60_01190 [Candidatus Pacearchaeota archaeon CG10_big_fil_rev_8_21_14_0_10_34_76]|nr:MAG: hypothetical protein COU60_01190 [Candidatus Pacearchaeota archaeon CG10_big_fil_rev_8_21_14_0_10_34_76]
MFWIFNGKKRVENLEENTKRGFEEVKKDFEGVGKWIKHLDNRDKQLFDIIREIKSELSSINDEVDGLREALSLMNFASEGKQLSKKQTGVGKQMPVYSVQEPVQTPVQTGNFHQILQNLSANERLIVLTLLNAEGDMKLSYEDIAKLLGKERSTIRGQINSIKQKSESLVYELTEPNGKKRVYIPEEIKEKLLKYAKVRVGNDKKSEKKRKK